MDRATADKFAKAALNASMDEIKNKKEEIIMEDILKPEEGQTEVSYVLVEGEPGMGKSTFALEICRQWDTIEALKKFRAVVLLRLRDKTVREAKSVEDLIYHDRPSIHQAVVDQICSNGGE